MKKSLSVLLGLTLAVAATLPARAQEPARTQEKFVYVRVRVPASSLRPTTFSEYRNVLSFAPTHLLRGVRFGYERVITPTSTVGGFFTGHGWLFDFRGVELAPFWRIYFARKAPEGFYFQPKVLIGFNSRQTDSRYYGEGWNYTYDPHNQHFGHVGAGVSVGYQVLFGFDRRWTFDVSLGLRVVTDVPTEDRYFGGLDYRNNSDRTADDNSDWHIYDMGSPLDVHLAFGYRF